MVIELWKQKRRGINNSNLYNRPEKFFSSPPNGLNNVMLQYRVLDASSVCMFKCSVLLLSGVDVHSYSHFLL